MYFIWNLGWDRTLSTKSPIKREREQKRKNDRERESEKKRDREWEKDHDICFYLFFTKNSLIKIQEPWIERGCKKQGCESGWTSRKKRICIWPNRNSHKFFFDIKVSVNLNHDPGGVDPTLKKRILIRPSEEL